MAKNNPQIKELKRENDDLKAKITDLQNELKVIKKKLDAGTTDDELRNSVNFVSAEYDDLKETKSQIERDIKTFDRNLTEIAKKVYDIDESIESIMAYSYQYNIKIMGIPQAKDSETAEESVSICLKLFRELGAKVCEQDIDIAHRLQNRNSTRPAAIVCKFTRRIAKEAVMTKKKELRNVDLRNAWRIQF